MAGQNGDGNASVSMLLTEHYKQQGLDPEVTDRLIAPKCAQRSLGVKKNMWCKFLEFCSLQQPPVRVVPGQGQVPSNCVVNFLGKIRTVAGELISYGYFRAYRAAIMTPLSDMQGFQNEREALQLVHKLTEAVKAQKKQKPKYDQFFSLDGVLATLVANYDARPASSLLKEHVTTAMRTELRQRAVNLIKLEGMHRSGDMSGIMADQLYNLDTESKDAIQSGWGAQTAQDEQGHPYPAWVRLRFLKTKTTGVKSVKLDALAEEPALCPVLHLFCYVRQNLQIPEESRPVHYEDKGIWWSVNKQCEQRFTVVTSADTIGHTTLGLLMEAGIDTEHFKAHALRGAVANDYMQKGATADAVCANGGWTSSAFEIFYKRSKIPQLGMQNLTHNAVRPRSRQTRPSKEDVRAVQKAGGTGQQPATRKKNALSEQVEGSKVTVTEQQLKEFCIQGKQKAGLPLVRNSHPDGKAWRIPGANEQNNLFCAICDDAEQSTLMWCNNCNEHYHVNCAVGPGKTFIRYKKEFSEWLAEGALCEVCSKAQRKK